MKRIWITINLFILCSSGLSQPFYQITAAGSFFDIEQDSTNKESLTIQLNLSLQWVEGDRIYNDSLATISGNLHSQLRESNSYIFYIDTTNQIPEIVDVLPLTSDLAKTTLDELGTPDFSPAREGFQVYPIFNGWFWSKNFGLYKIVNSIGESSRGLGFHEQLGWIFIRPEGLSRADWTVWIWHYITRDWLYVDLFSYPWMYSAQNGWIYLLQEIDPEINWLFYYNSNFWSSVGRT